MQVGESCCPIRLGRKADFLENTTGLSFIAANGTVM